MGIGDDGPRKGPWKDLVAEAEEQAEEADEAEEASPLKAGLKADICVERRRRRRKGLW
ncbi:MAG: hypothetical protein VXW00_16105 [Candidatus Latescibacterota bacterium]|nr:hypothetical protein [Candidatus Latescibacterota bacterium]